MHARWRHFLVLAAAASLLMFLFETGWLPSSKAPHRRAFYLLDSCADRNKDRLPLISVAAIDGAAIGGGGELSTACDFRVAGPECNIRFVQVKV